MDEAVETEAQRLRRHGVMLVLRVAIVFLPVAAVTAANPVEQIAYPVAIVPFGALYVAGRRRWLSQRQSEVVLLALGTALVTILFWGLLRADATVAGLADTGTSFAGRNSLMLIAVAFLLLGPRGGLRYAVGLILGWVGLTFGMAAQLGPVTDLVGYWHEFLRAFLSTIVTVTALWALTTQTIVWASGHAAAQVRAERDQLTGLANRHGLTADLSSALEADAAAVCVAMVDIDHFKRVNDTHGHDVGDATLVAVADALQQAVREGELVARWGGEEFVVVLRGGDLDRAAVAAERCRVAVAERRPRRAEDDWFPPVTVSIGVAAGRRGDDVESVVARADEQLYRAKEAGRDCVRTTAG